MTEPSASSEHDLRQALETLEDFFDNGVVGLHLVARDGTILRANRAELAMLGYSEDEYVGQPIARFHDDPATIADILKRLARGERLDRYAARLRCKDGSLRDVLISSSALFRDGRFINTRCFTVDVTDQRTTEAALATEQLRLSLAAQTAGVGVWDWDLTTDAIVYSEVAKRILGFPPNEPVTFDMVRDATHPEDYPITWPMARRATDPAIRERLPYEYRVVRPDGEIRWVLAHGHAVFDGEGREAKALRYVGAIQDITERRQLLDALALSQDRLRVAMEAAKMAVWDSQAGSIVEASAGLLQTMGLPPQAATTLEDLRTRYAPGEQERVQAEVQAAYLAGKRDFEAEYRYLRADGTPGWLLLRAEFEPAPEGTPPKAVGVLIDITARKQAEAALVESEERLRALADNLPNGMIYQMISTADGGRRFTFVSNNCERLNGVPAERATQDPASLYALIHPDDRDAMAAAEAEAIATQRPFDHELRMRGPGGDYRWHRLSAGPRSLPAGAILWDGIQIDIDARHRAEDALQQLNAELEKRVAHELGERLKAEEALRQAQKMEAVGQLTGGVAHDFNNLLTIILGGLDTIRRSEPGDAVRIQRAANMAVQGAERAVGLTQRLLAFSRRQPLDPRPADLNGLIRGMNDLLHRTLGETVELECVLSPRLWPVEVDANQLEAAILNLALNARDAMPGGGRLTVETTNASLDEGYTARDAEVIPGQYVQVSVSDTGGGIPSDTLSRVFEPFFTTKEVGKGTGLGLSMVYGFIKQSGGHVAIYSEPGLGTSVKLYFPRYLGGAQPADPAAAMAPLGHGTEVILVVEDNDDVRGYSAGVLNELGYRVLEAANASDALAILAGTPVDLLFTDVVLPGESGRVLADKAASLCPGLKILFTTGYSRNAIVHHGRLDPGVNLLAKPFTFEDLAGRIRDVLDRGG